MPRAAVWRAWPAPAGRRRGLRGGRKDAVDLDTVRADLARVVQAALEPAHVCVRASRDGYRSR
jgi:hypothetical protein